MTGPANLSLEVSRFIVATPQRLFHAWTSPEHLMKWWGPPGGHCVAATVQPFVGGTYRLDNALADGRLIAITGTFTRVDDPHVLVYTWRIEPGAAGAELVTVTFTGRDGGTEVKVRHERIIDAVTRDGHALGWLACLDRLAMYA